MPCTDSSSGLNIFLDHDENFIRFEFAKITCSQEIKGGTGLSGYCAGKPAEFILDARFEELAVNLRADTEEKQFILYLEWEALRAGIAQYLGIERSDIDTDRCCISEISHTDEGIEISEVVLPPQELPKIIPCSKAEKS